MGWSGDYWLSISIIVICGSILTIMLIERRKLKKMAYEDAMTGLLNRNALNQFIQTQKGNDQVAVLFLDLDQFKDINDRLGHHVGDLLIQEVGNRLKLFMNSNMHVFRIGGDEFLIIAKHFGRHQAELLAEQVLYSIRHVYDIDGLDLRVSGSIGICIGTMQDDPLVLLKNADSAMYKAKHKGRNQYDLFTDAVSDTE